MNGKRCELRQDGKKFTTVNSPLRALSILRVSTRKQMTEGEGIENQRRHNAGYIERKGYRLVKEEVLAESAEGEDRTGFEDIINYTIAHKDEIDVWVLYKVDRFTRGGIGAYYAIKKALAKVGVRIEFSTQEMDDSSTGELMEGILAVMARFENRLRTDRTIGVEKILTKQGYWCRSAPTGFINARENDDPKGKPILKPTPDKNQWDLLCYGLRKHLLGGYRIMEVAEDLRKKGFRSKAVRRRGEKERQSQSITQQSWTKIVRNPIYGGLLCEKWTDNQYVRAKFDGPLFPDEWRALQDVLDGRTKALMPSVRKKRHADFPLRQFLLCPACGSKVRGSRSTGKMKKPYWYYHCKNKACHFMIQTKEIHSLFEDYLQKITPSPELVELFREVVLESFAERHKIACASASEVEKELNAIRDDQQTLISLMQKNADKPELLKGFTERYQEVCKRYSLANVKRGERVTEEVQAQVVVDYCAHFLLHAHKLWKEAQPAERFRLQSLIFPEGISYDALTGKQTPKISPVYEAISDLKKGDTAMAAPRRIELRFPG